MRLMLIGVGFVAIGFAIMAVGVHKTPRRSASGFTAPEIAALSNVTSGSQMVSIGCGALDKSPPEPECVGR